MTWTQKTAEVTTRSRLVSPRVIFNAMSTDMTRYPIVARGKHFRLIQQERRIVSICNDKNVVAIAVVGLAIFVSHVVTSLPQ
jgi:hypothetical protein